MEGKRARAVRLLEKYDHLLLCPTCGKSLAACSGFSFACPNGHCLDMSKKGVLNLSTRSNDRVYDRELFLNRRAVIKNGSYKPLTDAIKGIIQTLSSNGQPSILDAGCGEGSFLDELSDNDGLNVGIDLSSEGINLATDNDTDIIWLIDDLARMHISDASFDVIMNILSPANHHEFQRLLNSNGIVIKVIPGANYLCEIRDILSSDASDSDSVYDNSKTMEHTYKGLNVIDRKNVNYMLRLSEREFENFIGMTPLTHGKQASSPKRNEVCGSSAPAGSVYGLTIDLEVIAGNYRPYSMHQG